MIYTNKTECLRETAKEAVRTHEQKYVIHYGYHYESIALWTLQAEGKTPEYTIDQTGQIIH